MKNETCLLEVPKCSAAKGREGEGAGKGRGKGGKFPLALHSARPKWLGEREWRKQEVRKASEGSEEGVQAVGPSLLESLAQLLVFK